MASKFFNEKTFRDITTDRIDSQDHLFVKRLKKEMKLGYKLEKMLIVDYTLHKSKENYGNAICISEFKGDNNEKNLLALIEYFDTLKYVENVHLLVKRSWKEQLRGKNKTELVIFS